MMKFIEKIAWFIPTSSLSICVLAVLISSSASAEGGQILCYDSFDAEEVEAPEHDVEPAIPLSLGSQAGGEVSVSAVTSTNFNRSGGSLKGVYPQNAEGENYIWANCDISEFNVYEIYVEFKAKMPGTVHGIKFLKIFGQGSGGSANTTFQNVYHSGDFEKVYFGDGTKVGNDVANVINFDGSDKALVGRSYPGATVRTPQYKVFKADDWGPDWHHFKFKVKYNSGTSSDNEVANGEYYVEIDGKVFVDAEGLFNRHYSNKPIRKVSLFGWTQDGRDSFEVWYDDLIVSTGGFINTKYGPAVSVKRFEKRP